MTETALTEVTTNQWREYSAERREKKEIMQRMCEVVNIPRPIPFTEEERVVMNLTIEYVNKVEEIGKQRLDRTMLPVLLEETSEANVPREGLLRERVRHGANYVGGGMTSALSGFAVGVITAALEAMVVAIDRAAVVLVPFTTTFLISCIVMTIQNNQANQVLTWQIIQHILFYSFWLASLFGLLSAVCWAAWTAYQRHRMAQEVERQRNRQVPDRIS